MKKISARPGIPEVALPSSIKTILRTIDRWLDPKKLPTYEIIINPPEQMFGMESFVPPVKAIAYDIMSVISLMLIDNEIVGERLQYFHDKYEELLDINGNRIISHCSSANFFAKSGAYIKSVYGDQTNLLSILISYDKTTLSRNGIRTATPVYVSIGNLDSVQLQKDISTDIIGFLPDIPLSETELHRALTEAGCKSKTRRIQAIRYYKKFIEQEVLFHSFCIQK